MSVTRVRVSAKAAHVAKVVAIKQTPRKTKSPMRCMAVPTPNPNPNP